MVKNKIFEYFFIEFFKLFILISLSFSILIWMTQAARLLELVTEYGNSIPTYLKYILLIYPKILDNIFILCFGISMFFFFNKLENSNELIIYWLSGISKIKIVRICLIISFICVIFNIILSSFIAPYTSSVGRKILGKSKFTLINSLVKENNFNSPLKGLTLYVDENDKKGNLRKVFIFENSRTIIAKSGQVLVDDNENSYLKLFDGATHEQTNGRINIINFKNTIFDFSKYQLQNISVLKFSERDMLWLFQNSKNKNNPKVHEIREELNKRLLKPFSLLIITILSCFLLYKNEEKINYKKYNAIIYTITLFIIILNQVLIKISGTTHLYTLLYIIFTIFILITLLFMLKKITKSKKLI